MSHDSPAKSVVVFMALFPLDKSSRLGPRRCFSSENGFMGAVFRLCIPFRYYPVAVLRILFFTQARIATA
ncbi:MAG TPA: hypothetical protein DEB39_16245 [Planctomycetaceae bacterium]|nr:hypothetical protein [Planctomycetaceae bacterium]